MKMTLSGAAAGLLISLVLLCGCMSALKTGNASDPGTPAVEKNRYVKAIEVFQKPETTRIHIESNKKLTFTSVKQSFPLGIAVYLPETQMGSDLIAVQRFRSGMVNSVVAGFTDQEKTTLKIEVILGDNAEYEVTENENGLWLTVTRTPEPEIEKPVVMLSRETAGGESDQTGPESSDNGRINQNKREGNAVLSGIEFDTTQDGETRIDILTSHTIDYKVNRSDSGQLIIELLETDIPEYRLRPFITKYFKSAVERVEPVRTIDNSSIIQVTLREMVPYRVVQQQTTLSLIVEPTTEVPPAMPIPEMRLNAGNSGESPVPIVVAESGTVDSKQVPETTGGEPMPVREKPEQTAIRESGTGMNTTEEPGSSEEKQYTGEKIRLDFFETDIKNVFRILRSVSGNNFAVDKDVSGNVTLTLDKPVPWDQVLDLVLKMNGLGKVQEGSIIRIATMDTLRREEDMRQAAFAAKQRSIEQEKKLEPLITEYIPINYSDAEKDIRPHLEKILTPERGQISVDVRTNMVIMTDVQDKINQAREMIYRLDKVTPQIMISARVVEVSEDFSRQLGIDWNISSEEVYRDDLGGEYGFDIAMNYPVASSSSIGYTFDRITGTPFALNARLTASETQGDVKIISSPRILTLDNKKAKIKQGIEYAYLERDDAGGSSVKFKDIDLLLEVTPHVTPDDRIAMSVYITKNDIDSITDGVPSLSTNEAETELLVNDGNTIVIGGIVKNSLTDSQTGFPYLSSIPVLGYLFGSDAKTERTNELLIFITPTIVQLEQRRN